MMMMMMKAGFLDHDNWIKFFLSKQLD